MSDDTQEILNDYSRYPIQDVDAIAKRLELAARTLRRYAEGFKDERLTPSGVLADIVSEYVIAAGSNGTYFNCLVSDVARLLAHREDAAVRSEIAALESRLNDAYYERDAAVKRLADLQERLDAQGGAR